MGPKLAPSKQQRAEAASPPSIASARAALLTPQEAAPSLSPTVPPALQAAAANAFLSDFAASVHAAALLTGEPASKAPVSSTGVPAADPSPGSVPSLTDSHFPPLGGHRPASTPARKKLTPSRVTPAAAATSSPSPGFAAGKAPALTPLQKRLAPSRMTAPAVPAPPPPISSPAARKPRAPTSSRARSQSPGTATLDTRVAGPTPSDGFTPQKQGVQQKSPPKVGESLQLYLDSPCLRRSAVLHANFVARSLSPAHTMCASLQTLADALRIPPRPCVKGASGGCGQGIFSMLPDGAYASAAALCAHAVLVFEALAPILMSFPQPLLAAITGNPLLMRYAPDVVRQAGAVVATFLPWKDATLFTEKSSAIKAVFSSWGTDDESETEVGPRRLSSNLEGVWDKVIDMQRMHRGDIVRVAAGSLDRDAVSRAIAALHPANMDAFGARFITLVARAAQQPDQMNNRDRLRRLNARMTSTSSTPTGSSSGTLAKAEPGARGAGSHFASPKAPSHLNAGGVVLHRVPDIVRELLSGDGAELFFLEFVDAADSIKLNDALTPRLSAMLHSTLADASSALAEESFTEAVLRARLFTKLLSVTMHVGNWAHSSFSFSGGETGATAADDKSRANSLPPHVVHMRSTVCAAKWTSCIDLAGILREALAAKHAPAVVAVALVVDIALRVASVDPISSSTSWYTSSVNSIQGVMRFLLNEGDQQWLWLSSVPLVRVVIEELLFDLRIPRVPPFDNAPGSAESTDVERGMARPAAKTAVRSFGNSRLVAGCVPGLEDLRRRLADTAVLRVAGIAHRRRIRPLPADGADSASSATEAALDGEGIADAESVNEGISAAGESATTDIGLDQLPDSSVRGELWQEFYGRLDKRIRDVAALVIASRDNDATSWDGANQFRQAAAVLLPDVPSSVVDVTARYCGRLSSRKAILRGPASQGDSDGPAGDKTAQPTEPLSREEERQGDQASAPAEPARVDRLTSLLWNPNGQAVDEAAILQILTKAEIRVQQTTAVTL